MKIKTTHVGSLPRPQAMNLLHTRNQAITQAEMEHFLAAVMEAQLSVGLTVINDGELPRQDYVRSTIGRLAGFHGSAVAPLPRDLEELPEYSKRFGGRNALITLNPKAPVKLPACSAPLEYTGEESLRAELDMMVRTFAALQRQYPGNDRQLFFTAPSPGTIALFLENKYYPTHDAYLNRLGKVLSREYEIISAYGVDLQIDCPDLAMGRHTRYKHLDDDQFLSLIDKNIEALNHALAAIPADRCRAHICWGNYPGTHHCDIGLPKIFDRIMRASPKYISLEASNHRHAHEWETFNHFRFPDSKILMPGVIDTTSNTVEHPRLVAQRLLNFARILGPERVIASTDCGFASTASATSVSGDVAWLKLKALVEGARMASEIL
jgi:5-methyltetrahydropteroyltriglutamate--homocysteine methyltransferase